MPPPPHTWDHAPKVIELAESRLIEAILSGHFSANSTLPPERALAAQLGITRPTLREALQRINRDGWIEIRHGRPTRVRNFWQEGSLGVLSALATKPHHLPENIVTDLLSIRCLLAPEYSRLAVSNNPPAVLRAITGLDSLPAIPSAYASADFELHRRLTIASENPIFTLILNGFTDLYIDMACLYFSLPAARTRSQEFYAALHEAAQNADADAAYRLTEAMMTASLALWQQAQEDKQR